MLVLTVSGDKNKLWLALFSLLHVILIFVFGYVFSYSTAAPSGNYAMFQDVHIMIFLGFGFLMSFMATNSWTATGHSMLVAGFSLLWALVNYAFWHGAFSADSNSSLSRVALGVDNIVNADFAAGAVLISFGAMIGRITQTQLLVMATIEVILFSVNEAILTERFGVADLGGSMVIHAFGAYFGLACSLVLERAQPRRDTLAKKDSPDTTHASDTLAMIGTIFLWCFWPSFNAYFGGQVDSGSANAQRAVVNTTLSITASILTTFYVSAIVNGGRVSMVDVQNATLAGGVAMGSSANMLVSPQGALLIGSIAGVISVVGYKFLLPKLDEVIGLKDTCGVHNLHGMPGIAGALFSIVVTAGATPGDYNAANSPMSTIWVKADSLQTRGLVGLQVASLLLTLGIALVGGVATGYLLRELPALPDFFTDYHEYITHLPNPSAAAAADGHGEGAAAAAAAAAPAGVDVQMVDLHQ